MNAELRVTIKVTEAESVLKLVQACAELAPWMSAAINPAESGCEEFKAAASGFIEALHELQACA